MSDEYISSPFKKGRANHTKAELNAVATEAKSGDREALDLLGEMMQPYVIAYLRRIGRGSNYTPEQRNEMTQEAWVGVWEALGRWDPARGVKFSSYAHHWQRHHVMEWISANTRSLRLPRKSWHYGALIKEAWEEQNPDRELWEATQDELRDLTVTVIRDGEPTKFKFDGGANGNGLLADDIVRALRQTYLISEDDDERLSAPSAEDDVMDGLGTLETDAIYALDMARSYILGGNEEGAWTAALDFVDTYDLPYEVAENIIKEAS